MRVPLKWAMICPVCKVMTQFDVVHIETNQLLILECESCKGQVEYKPPSEDWLEWLMSEKSGNA